MKINIGLPCLLGSCFIASSFQPATRSPLTAWITCPVDSQFSVQLPVQPTEMDMLKMFTSQGITPSADQVDKLKTMKLLTATDGIANYMITRTATGLEASLDEPGNRTSFYEGAVNGVLQNEHGTLLQRSAFTVGGAEGVEMRYKGVHKGTGKLVIKHNRMLAVGKVVYILAVYPVDRNDSTGTNLNEQRTKFFNSIAYKPSPQPSK